LPVGLPGPAACLRDPEGLRQALRQACRRCTARRGIAEPVACRLPPHLTVCRRHRLWIGSTGQPWQAGPYGTGSRDLLARHAADLGALLAAFDELVGRVRTRGGRMVITHGGPNAANVLKTPAGFVFVDWGVRTAGTART